jgi:hypothetical protein
VTFSGGWVCNQGSGHQAYYATFWGDGQNTGQVPFTPGQTSGCYTNQHKYSSPGHYQAWSVLYSNDGGSSPQSGKIDINVQTNLHSP